MTEDRKAELVKLCAVQIRQAAVLMKSNMADYGYYFVESVFDGEFWSTIPRLADKPVTDADMPLLRELIMEDLWPRLRAQHRDLRTFLFGKLPAKYPGAFAEDAEFAFDVGWRSLLQSAAERLQTYPSSWRAKISGGKEKFGCCVIYIDCDVGQPGARSEIERLREEVRLRSLATCDICGSHGRLRLSSIAKTVCDKHVAVLGEMREDDGMWADPWKWHEDRPLEDHIADVIATGRAVMSAVEETDLRKRIDDDTWRRSGREQDLLIEFSGVIEDAVNDAVGKAEHLDDYIAKELDGWRTTAVVPVSDRDREFLHGYLREFIDAEYERIRQKQEAERNNE